MPSAGRRTSSSSRAATASRSACRARPAGWAARARGSDAVAGPEAFFLKPRGYRQRERVPRLPRRVAESLIREFGSLKDLREASEAELDEVEGVGQARARAIQRGLERQRSLETPGEAVAGGLGGGRGGRARGG